VFLGGYLLDRCCDLRCIRELGEPIQPRSLLFQMLFDILHQVAEAFSFVIPCTLSLYTALIPESGLSTYIVCWRHAANGREA